MFILSLETNYERSWAGTYNDTDIKIITTMTQNMDEWKYKEIMPELWHLWRKMDLLNMARYQRQASLSLYLMCAGKK